jgi:DNA-binding SARP family transcriptional activator
MNVLKVRLFGHFQLDHAGHPDTVKVTRIIQGLLAYLLLYRHRSHPREVLAGLFWGDYPEARARSCLSTALWRLRLVLEPPNTMKGTYLITTPLGEVGFNREADYWLDVAVFEEKVGGTLEKPSEELEVQDASALQKALALYTGDLLEGFYEDWALRERERLRALQLKGLRHLMRYWKHCGDYEAGLECGRQILAFEPLWEEVHREVMRLYVANGQRALAIRQYQTCCGILDKELGIAPMEETKALHYHILQNVPPGMANSRPPKEPGNRAAMEKGSLAHVLHQLEVSTKTFEKFSNQLQGVIYQMEQYVRKSNSSKSD